MHKEVRKFNIPCDYFIVKSIILLLNLLFFIIWLRNAYIFVIIYWFGIMIQFINFCIRYHPRL